ncbi:MAG: hypothetical protein PUF11_09375 [Parafannyhessea umbonata]|uniref:hypothetical protein n=1 Tax=Parafannyhessea umbonata TaxID=604330 RepID=UPI0026EF24C3|nr:hypothetical protein [Parafannyhessea umbonata]MDD6566975.1 hypothetical protein [Parafannyhessea umbonata]
MTGASLICDSSADDKVTMKVDFTDGDWWAINFQKGGIFVYDYATNTSTSVKLA